VHASAARGTTNEPGDLRAAHAELADVTHHWVADGSTRIHALSTGHGLPTIVAIHGVAGFASGWMPFARARRGGGRLLAVDLLGHGETQRRPVDGYGSESQAEAVALLLDGLGLSATTVVGASWGGLVGLVLAATRPELVERLVMIDLAPSSTKAVDDVPPRPASFLSHSEVVAFERGRFPDAPEETVELLAAGGTFPDPGGRILPRHDPLFDRMWPFRAEDHWGRLSSLSQPLLVVRAGNSYVLQPQDADRMAATAPAGRLVTIPDAGHLVHLERPAELAAAVDEFIGSTRAA
jgi:pimeloyl-ACP methyl ester carboxylesterase